MNESVRRVCALCLLFSSITHAQTRQPDQPDLMLLNTYQADMDIAGWLMSEKLDGVRAYWTGSRLLSRRGRAFTPPDWFIKDFPPFALDGELWSKRGEFQKILSITAQHSPHPGWRHLRYKVFEVPEAPGGLRQRLSRVSNYLSEHPDTRIDVIAQLECRDHQHLQQKLTEIIALGGEGLVLRNPNSAYESGRTPNALKVKRFDDMQGVVIGYRPGKGKYQGLVGALHIELANGKRFYLGSGLSDQERASPPAIGERVDFRYQGFTEKGIPRFASYRSSRDLPLNRRLRPHQLSPDQTRP